MTNVVRRIARQFRPIPFAFLQPREINWQEDISSCFELPAMDGDATLLGRFREGDQAAAAKLFERYVKKLVALAQKRLSSHLGRRIDAEDVVQSAFRSFFRGASSGRFTIEPGQELWRLLAVMTVTKLRKQVEFHSAKKRNFQLERPPAPDESATAFLNETVAREPSVGDSLVLIEQLESITSGLDDDQQTVFAMRLEGHHVKDIAAAVNCSERTVRRVLDEIKRKLVDLALVDAAGEEVSLIPIATTPPPPSSE